MSAEAHDACAVGLMCKGSCVQRANCTFAQICKWCVPFVRGGARRGTRITLLKGDYLYECGDLMGGDKALMRQRRSGCLMIWMQLVGNG